MNIAARFPIPASEGLFFRLAGREVAARPSGALWVPELGLMAVADLHLGKAERMARRGGALLPPYECAETLARLEAEIAALRPACVVCVGDSFDDDLAARALDGEACDRLAALARGRRWIWVSGNHDPATPCLPGEAVAEHDATHPDASAGGPLVFRHIAAPGAAPGEVSGHYHPAATLAPHGRRIRRRCFLEDGRRVILPAFGAFTGGLCATDAAFNPLLGPGARALLVGSRVIAAPRSALSGRAG
ncbi:ligase-associated DNA damage response endonuclease PdeM [Rubrimonas cliftonensis]|uniref:Putative phosphoesterase n=1 Tax=Rubrimonas cliftonensis TaxID=89524 RepID=A0A1H3VQH4_9RHOB|nr:ligase-associated DNA damage response endonuclease PdeM [Rubrimonas cliftonensis]SDZ76348.1 putative phosphoesterase [Rubrimonas cliftonensis]